MGGVHEQLLGYGRVVDVPSSIESIWVGGRVCLLCGLECRCVRDDLFVVA